MLNPTVIGGGQGGSGYVMRQHLGTQELTSSGEWEKSAARVLPFLAEIPDDALSAVEVEIEAVGGGGGGQSSTTGAGGYPGGVYSVTVAWDKLIDDEPISVTIGDGGIAGAMGGTTYFGSDFPPGGAGFVTGIFVSAPGGLPGVSASADIAVVNALAQSRSSKSVSANPGSSAQMSTYSTLRPDSRDGPGGGGSYGGRGGIAMYERVTQTAHGEPGLPGSAASSTDSYGGGGGGRSTTGTGGAGGAPGGGGGNGTTGGAGGRGAVRLRYYVWRTA